MATTGGDTGVLVSEEYLNNLESYHKVQIELLKGLEASRADQADILNRLDRRLDQHEIRLQQNEKAINRLDNRLVKLETIVISIQEEQKELRKHVDDRFDSMNRDIDDRFDGVNQRMDGINQRMDDRFDSINQRMDDRFDGVNQRIEGISQRIFWTVTGGFAFLTIVLGFMTYILKVPVQ